MVKPTVIFRKEPVNLTESPQECDEFGAHQSLAPKMGDGHACLQKLLWFVLKTGLARFDSKSESESSYDFYTIHEYAELCTAQVMTIRLNPKNFTAELANYADIITLMKKYLAKLRFHDKAVMLFLGDLFMDRNGNDLFTAMFIKRIQDCGARPIIALSNHDVEFIKWLTRFVTPTGGYGFMDSCGQSSRAFQIFLEYRLSNCKELEGYLNEAYYKNLVAFYYEIGPQGEIDNISSHAPNGEWEIYEMVQGLAFYATLPQHQRLFTEIQRERLQAFSHVKFDEHHGLSRAQLRECMDLMNEILHTNAMKPNKNDLCDLMDLGIDHLTPQQIRGHCISPRISPYYRLIWNRESPRAAPPGQERRQFLNGHHNEDLDSHPTQYWIHNNISLDDRAGQAANLMVGQSMRYALPVPGYTPMPPVTVMVTRPGPISDETSELSPPNNNN